MKYKKEFEVFIFVIVLFILNGLIMTNINTKPDEWYKKIKKSELTPPGYVFGIVWSILYILIIIAYTIGLSKLNYELWIIPTLQLLLNFSYSPVFFYYKNILGGAILTTLILIFTLVTLYIFSKKTIEAVYILIPYVIWLLFANYLAWSIYFLNN